MNEKENKNSDIEKWDLWIAMNKQKEQTIASCLLQGLQNEVETVPM